MVHIYNFFVALSRLTPTMVHFLFQFIHSLIVRVLLIIFGIIVYTYYFKDIYLHHSDFVSFQFLSNKDRSQQIFKNRSIFQLLAFRVNRKINQTFCSLNWF